MICRACVAHLGVLAGLLIAGSAGAAEAAASSDANAGSALPAEHANADTSSSNSDSGGRPEHGMHNSISLLGNFGYAYSGGSGFGLSGRYQYTVVPEGFLHSSSVHDDLGVEAALDYFHYSIDLLGASWSYNEFGLSASAVWNLWFTKQFAAYPRLGLGFAFGSFSGDVGFNTGSYGGLFLVGGAGVLYQLSALTLRAEVSNSYLGLGVALSL